MTDQAPDLGEEIRALVVANEEALRDPAALMNLMMNLSEREARKEFGDDEVNKVLSWIAADTDHVLAKSIIAACHPYEIAVYAYRQFHRSEPAPTLQ